MAVTFKPQQAINAELFLAKESSENVFTEAGAVQVSHRGIPQATLGHSPIDGSSNHGSAQVIIGDAWIRGVHRPAIRATFPLRYNSLEVILNAMMGADHAAGVWSIANAPTSWSVGFTDGIKYWKFAGCYIAELDIALEQEAVGEARMLIIGASLAWAAAGGFPALTPSHAQVPYTVLDCTFRHHTVYGSLAGASPVKFKNSVLQFRRTVELEHYNDVDPTLSPGKFRLSGSMAHRISTEFYSEFDHVAQPDGTGFSTEYCQWQCTSTPGSKLFTVQAPSRWNLTEVSVPVEGMDDGGLEFMCGADDGSLTVPTAVVTCTAF